jgi:elongation factor 2
MVKYTPEDLKRRMEERENIRNICVVAHVDHGKSTLTDSLVLKAGLINEEKAGNLRVTDTRRDEQERGITIKSTGLSLLYQIDDPDTPTIDKKSFLVNLIDSPGHVDFSAEVTAALRVTDGALVVVDCVEGVCVQTGTVLRQALNERVRPVLMVNKMDRVFSELHLEAEDCYQTFRKVIESVNAVIGTYGSQTEMEDLMVDPTKGNVAFGSGLQGWAFTLRTFAKFYAKKYGVSKEKMMEKLWGDNYFDAAKRRWVTKPISTVTGKKLQRGWCQLVFKPIRNFFTSILSDQKEKIQVLLEKYGVKLTSVEKELTKKDLLKVVLRHFLPAGDALVEMILLHLPSPVEAQKYRVEVLYTGPLDDPCAQAIRDCDPDGPLMMYVSKMVPAGDSGRFYAFGRVFSGRVKSGMKVRILGPNHISGTKVDQFENKSVQRTVLMMGRCIEAVSDCPCGNTIGLVGMDSYLAKCGTITDCDTAFPIKTMKFSVFPVIAAAVSPANKEDLPKLVAGLRLLATSDPCLSCTISESSELLVEATGELHLEISLQDLQEQYARVPLVISEPIVAYRETVTTPSTITCLAKSANRHNRLFLKAEPLDPDLTTEIEDGTLPGFKTNSSTSQMDVKARAQHLMKTYNWTQNDSQKIWCFGPDHKSSNVFVNQTNSALYLNEVRDSIVAGFQWAMKNGALCDEPMRGVRFNLIDVNLHADAIHRGAGQIIPTTRRVLYASQLTAKPRLQQPFYLVTVQCPVDVTGTVYSTISRRKGVIVTEERADNVPLSIIKAYLPVSESFGFQSLLRSQTSGQAFPQFSFDHWETMEGDPFNPQDTVGELVLAIRKRKGLSPGVDPLTNYLDKL